VWLPPLALASRGFNASGAELPERPNLFQLVVLRIIALGPISQLHHRIKAPGGEAVSFPDTAQGACSILAKGERRQVARDRWEPTPEGSAPFQRNPRI
jgi:hypothetical protein